MYSHFSKPLLLLILTVACCGQTAEATAIASPAPAINGVPPITPITPIVVPITPIIEKPSAPVSPSSVTVIPVKAITIPVIPASPKATLPIIKLDKHPITAKAKLTLDPKKYYQVKTGDNLDSISKRSGQSFKNLAKWNHLSPPYAVQNGQILNLFDLSGPTTAPPPVKQNPQNTDTNKKNRDGIQNSTISAVKNTQITTIISSPEKSSALATSKKKFGASKKAATPKGKMAQLSFKWPINGKIIKGFSKSNNQGIDIENKMPKQSVLAAEAGQVVYAGSGLSNLKNLIIIKHDQQYLTAYANNSKLLVTEDQQVKTGQTIAEITTPPKKNSTLHFEIRKNGTPVNPMNLLSK